MPAERPILFSAPMVLAILAGRKVQTRRGLRWPVLGPNIGGKRRLYTEADLAEHRAEIIDLCPYGRPGRMLTVKEAAWMWCERRPNGVTKTGRPKWHYVPLRSAPVLYCADHPARPQTSIVSPETGNEWGWRKKLGRFLPKWASRITLEITEVRVQRLQEITQADALAEGVPDTSGAWGDLTDTDRAGPRGAFEALWNSIHGDHQGGNGWDANPWVWAISFRRVEAHHAR